MRDIPFSSACLVSHYPGGAMPISKDGKVSDNLTHDLDYTSRQGRWAEKGGCDSAATREDRELAARAAARAAALDDDLTRNMDYVERLGRFSGKGAGLMEDCSHWGPDGPVSRAALEEDMLRCGGHYLKSIVTIDRNYAQELGIDSKEAFQSLMRTTWSKSVLKWGVPGLDDSTQVRWVAQYHTDAPHSLHVHVTTWFPKSIDVPDGWRVTAANTRVAKQEVYRKAYEIPRLEQERERDYLRQLLPAIARTELGRDVSQATVDRLQQKAGLLGVGVNLERTVGDGAFEAQVLRLRELYEQGEGRISRNYPLEAAARDVCDRLYAESEPYRRAWDAYRQMIEDKADMAGLAVKVPESPEVEERYEPGELSRAQEVTRHMRDKMVRKEMDDVKHRISSQVIRALDPTSERDAIVRDLAREVSRGHALDALYRHERLGISQEEHIRAVREVSQAMLDRALSPDVSMRLSDAYSRALAADGLIRPLSGSDAALEHKVATEIADATGEDPERVKGMLREHAGEDLAQVFSLERPAIGSDGSAERAARTLTRLVMESREMGERLAKAVDRESEHFSRCGVDREQARQLLRDSVSRSIEHSAAHSISSLYADPQRSTRLEVGRALARGIDRERSLYSLAMEDRGAALRIAPEGYRILHDSVAAMRDLCARGLGQEGEEQEYNRAAWQAASIIAMSPRVQEMVESYSQSYAGLTGKDVGQMRQHLTLAAAQQIERSVRARVEYDVANDRPILRNSREAELEPERDGLVVGIGMSIADLASQLARAIARSSRGGQAYSRRRQNKNEREQRYID